LKGLNSCERFKYAVGVGIQTLKFIWS